MLRVTLETVPFGIEANRRLIGNMRISNVGGSPEVGRYQVELGDNESGKKYAYIPRFRRNLGAWRLVQRAIEKALDAQAL